MTRTDLIYRAAALLDAARTPSDVRTIAAAALALQAALERRTL